MEYPWSGQSKRRGRQISSVGEHGQTVGDISKSQNTDPPKVGVALFGETKINFWYTAPSTGNQFYCVFLENGKSYE